MDGELQPLHQQPFLGGPGGEVEMLDGTDPAPARGVKQQDPQVVLVHAVTVLQGLEDKFGELLAAGQKQQILFQGFCFRFAPFVL